MKTVEIPAANELTVSVAITKNVSLKLYPDIIIGGDPTSSKAEIKFI